jgi:hypothetical protein
MLIVMSREEQDKMKALPKSVKVISSIDAIPSDQKDIMLVMNHKAVRIKNGKRTSFLIDYNKNPKDWTPKKVRFAKMIVTFSPPIIIE